MCFVPVAAEGHFNIPTEAFTEEVRERASSLLKCETNIAIHTAGMHCGELDDGDPHLFLKDVDVGAGCPRFGTHYWVLGSHYRKTQRNKKRQAVRFRN